MEKPNKKDFEYYQKDLVFKTVDVLKYSKALEKYIDYLEEYYEPKTEICPVCEGKGTIDNDGYQEDCMKCHWSGRIEIKSDI